MVRRSYPSSRSCRGEGVAKRVERGMIGDNGPGGCSFDEGLEDRRIGAVAETGWRCGRADGGGRIGLPARLGSEALSLADPMEPPPSVVTGRGNGPEVTPDRFGLSSPTATWQAWDEGAGQGRYAVAPWAPPGGAISPGQRLPRIAPPSPPAPPGSTLPACRLRFRLDGTRSIGAYWVRSLDLTEDFCSIGVPGNELPRSKLRGTRRHWPGLLRGVGAVAYGA